MLKQQIHKDVHIGTSQNILSISSLNKYEPDICKLKSKRLMYKYIWFLNTRDFSHHKYKQHAS